MSVQSSRKVSTTVKIKMVMSALRNGHMGVVATVVRCKLYMNAVCCMVRLDLTKGSPIIPKAGIPISIRPLENEDIPTIFDQNVPGITDEGIMWRERQMRLVKADIGTCYVAVTQDNDPCYLSWLFTAAQNGVLQEYFDGEFPILKPDEMISDRGFVIERYRNQGIYMRATQLVAQTGRNIGVRRVIGFSGLTNIAALKMTVRTGWEPYMIRKEQIRLFRRKFIFEPLPPGFGLSLALGNLHCEAHSGRCVPEFN